MPITSAPSAGTEEGYTFAINSEGILQIYSEADGTGGINNKAIKVTGDISGSNDLYITNKASIGNIIIGNNIISASNNNGLSLFDNNNNGMFIKDGGNVGIGTTSPTEQLQVNGTISSSGNILFDSNIIQQQFDTYIGSETYQSGFAGSGWKIDNVSGDVAATFDSLTVRGSMNIYELLIHQIRATNGSI
jgi:hypothetical protein